MQDLSALWNSSCVIKKKITWMHKSKNKNAKALDDYYSILLSLKTCRNNFSAKCKMQNRGWKLLQNLQRLSWSISTLKHVVLAFYYPFYNPSAARPRRSLPSNEMLLSNVRVCSKQSFLLRSISQTAFMLSIRCAIFSTSNFLPRLFASMPSGESRRVLPTLMGRFSRRCKR